MSYGDVDRSYVADFLPASFRSVLDVGSGSGRFLEELKRKQPGAETWAIDPNQDCSSRDGIDVFVRGAFPSDMPERSFDVIVFNDVLEHMVDPWAALRCTHPFLNPGGIVVASIPNVRHYSVVKPLVINGTFRYRDAGLLDRTHLRFFTLVEARALFEDAGFAIVRCEHRHLTSTGTAARLLRLGGAPTIPFRARHIVVSARPTDSTATPS